jgi:hypothetical protein
MEAEEERRRALARREIDRMERYLVDRFFTGFQVSLYVIFSLKIHSFPASSERVLF